MTEIDADKDEAFKAIKDSLEPAFSDLLPKSNKKQ